jgi:hypothetical protein
MNPLPYHSPAARRPSSTALDRSRLLREAYVRAQAAHENTSAHGYGRWLESKGINPLSGAMTEAGLAYFKQLLDRERMIKPYRARLPRPPSPTCGAPQELHKSY